MEASKRHINCDQISDSLYYYSLNRNETNQHCEFQRKNLVIIFAWYGGKHEQYEKYCQLYHSRGFDTLLICTKLLYFMWPRKAIQFSRELNNILESRFSNYKNFIVHAFSIGAFLFTICNHTPLSNGVANILVRKTIGIIYDSITIGDLSNMMEGLSIGMGLNGVSKAAFKLSNWSYFYIFRRCTADLYEKYVKLYIESPLNVPTFLLSSKDDPMIDYNSLLLAIRSFQDRLPVFRAKVWETSKHAAHLKYHYNEYSELLDNFLQTIQQNSSKISARSKL